MCNSTTLEEPRQLLPTNVKPLNYDVVLEPKFDNFSFDGTVKIELQVNEDSTTVAVNSLDIVIHESSIISDGKTQSCSVSFNDDDQSAIFTFADSIAAGSTAVLSITFTGELNDKMAGFYRSSYEEDGVTKYLATTQMEPTDCRRAFPCFDEPALKATYDITLIADEKLTCLSNMDVKSEISLGNGQKSVAFNKTPLMSTYLVAFIVGELKYVEVTDFRIPVRVYATPGLELQGKFSCELASKTLKFFEDTFDIPFPLPKMDMVAIHDFSAGAMENWGLVTYRVVDLLFDESTASSSTKQRVAEVVQHELAHQWFGNLVTMDWWDGLWLNEGFATWMSWYSCNAFYPEWKVWEMYVTDNLQSALRLDGLRSSHPVQVPVKRADEINQIFDAISYSKGSAVLMMISRWLGEEDFIKGVSAYLKKHQYGNTKTADLWEALSEASGKDVVSVMDIWTKEVGYPVVTVTESEKTINIKQNRFLTTGDVKPEEDNVIYPVFLGLNTNDGFVNDFALTERETTIEVNNTDFIKLNTNHSGIYRTLYTPERVAKLGLAGKEGLLSVEDRAGLVADVSALCVSGYQGTSSLLELISSWTKESENTVWEQINVTLSAMSAAWNFEPESVRNSFKAFQRELVSEKVHSLGWKFTENDGFLTQQLKTNLFSIAARSEDPIVVKAAVDMFNAYIAGDKSAINPNIRAIVFSTALKNGGEAEWNALLNIYKTTTAIDEKIVSLRSLGASSEPKLMEKTLALIFDGGVRSQDVYIPMQGLRSHPAGIRALWKWTTENWDKIVVLLPPGLSMLGSVVTINTSGFTKQVDLDAVKAYFETKNTKGFNMSLLQSQDQIKSKINWLERDAESVKAWLEQHKY
ncbi:aminopeptidase [Nadsonia fulvescens var. elongata DSM 6958]|uniref:Aminopeptidase n=1 Tax=Nadsonia fulvescens var. elongata DSM 6958 TaxID=857566 RepID=A0A1E3PDX0_9ASCO|nr:aminopeptidase [Nadsonia fulvescens var. elongata DSM 6958]